MVTELPCHLLFFIDLLFAAVFICLLQSVLLEDHNGNKALLCLYPWLFVTYVVQCRIVYVFNHQIKSINKSD